MFALKNLSRHFPPSSLCKVCHHRQTLLRQTMLVERHRLFHSSQSARVPIVPIPAILLSALKTGKLVSLVSLSSKTSLTLLPHTFRKGGKIQGTARVLASIPLLGFLLLLVVGLDQAPNTSRLRLIYLTEEEEAEIVKAEMNALLESQRGLIAPKDSDLVLWLQTIVDNLAKVSGDDVRDPVRSHPVEKQGPVLELKDDSGEVGLEKIEFRPAIPQRDFDINLICDSTSVNAMCAGSLLVIYDLMLYHMEYDPTKVAVILSHEIAHSIQRHFVEQHGFASLMFMLGDITRGVFWMITEPLGPYVNQKINEYISALITLETQTTYNRALEKEADLVGLKMMAKAGYDPRAALDVWQKMADLDQVISQAENQGSKKQFVKRSLPPSSQGNGAQDAEYGVREFLESLVNSWFGSTHPPNLERLEYMRQHMDEAVAIYHDAIRLNGPPKEYIFSDQEASNSDSDHSISRYFGRLGQWIVSLYYY